MRKFMIVIAALAMAGAAQAQPVQPGTAQINLPPDRPLLTITASETVRAAPDIASVGIGVQTLLPTAAAALAENSTKMTRVIAALRGQGVAERDIQTSGISLNPEYDYNNVRPGTQPRFLGFRVSNTVRVISRDIPRLGRLLDAMVTAGGNSIEGPTFSIENPDPLVTEARAKALASADAQARDLARRAGFERVRMVTITQGVGYRGETIMVTAQATGSRGESAAAPPVAPGLVGTTVNLTVQYQLER